WLSVDSFYMQSRSPVSSPTRRSSDLFVEALTIDVVGHADGDFANAGEHVELGEEVIGKTVDARCVACNHRVVPATTTGTASVDRSEEHTSELQSRFDLVCRLRSEQKK